MSEVGGSNAPQPKAAIVIANWNGRRYLDDCLVSVFAQSYTEFEVIFVDNASADDSIDYVRREFPKVKVIQLPLNLGFVGGSNIGISCAISGGAKYVVLLNNDTRVDRTWLSELVKTAEADLEVGICFSKVLLYDEPGIINSAGGECDIWGFPRDRGFLERDSGQYGVVEDVFEGCGASMLIKWDVLANVGDLDSEFFMYDEDTDLAWRARLYGYKVVYVPHSVVYHRFGGTGGSANARRRYLAIRNMLRAILKNAGPRLLAEMLPRFLVMKTVEMIVFLVTGRGRVSMGIAEAIMWNVGRLPSTISARRRIQKSRRVSDREIMKLLAKRSFELQMFCAGYLSKFERDSSILRRKH